MARTPQEELELQALKQQYIQLKQPSQEDTGFFDRAHRGYNLLESTLGRAVEASGEIFGIDAVEEAGRVFAERNQLEADLIAPPMRGFDEDAFGFIGDALVEGIPSIGAMGAGAATGAAVGSAVPVVGTAVGALTGLGLTAFGLNLGTVKEIETALQEDSEADLTTLLVAGAATIPDILTGGALSQTAKASLKEATKKTIAKNVAKDTAIGVGAAAATSATMEVGATLSTEAGFDQERTDTIASNVANSVLVATAATPTLSTAAATAGRLATNLETSRVEDSAFQFAEDGVTVEMVEPNPEALRSTDVLRKATTAMGLGTSVDELIMSQPDNLTIRSVASDFDTTFDERARAGSKTTVGVEAQLKKGEFLSTGGTLDLKNKTKAERKGVVEDLVNGVVTEETTKLRSMFRDVRAAAQKAGVYMGDLGDTYFPFLADVNKIKANKQDFINDMVDGARGRVKDIDDFRTKVVDYTNKLLDNGADMMVGDSSLIPEQLLKTYDEYTAHGGSDRVREKLIAELRKPLVDIERKGSINKNNALEQHRTLSSVKADVLNKWAKDEDILDVLDVYTQSTAERIAYAERFGANNEKLHSIARLAQLEGLEKGQPVNPAAIEKLYNVADLQQRITAKRVSPEYRDNVRAAKSTVNVLTLGLSVLSSIAEVLFIPLKTDTSSFLKGGVAAVETASRKIARTVLKDIPISERERALQGMNTGYRQAVNHVTARMGEDTASLTPTKVDQVLFKYNLLAPWTEFSRSWAQFSAIEHFKQDANTFANMKLSKGKRLQAAQRLAEAGLDPNQVARWVEKGASTNAPEYRAIKGGAINIAEDVIFNPSPVRKPTWMSDPTWYIQLFGQLKSFPITFTNRLAIPTARKIMSTTGVNSVEHALKLGTTLSVVGAGFMVQDAIKSAVKEGNLEKWEDKTPKERVMNAFSQLGSTSLFVDPLISETKGGSAVEALAGPAFSKSGQVVGHMGNLLFGDTSPEEYVEDVMATLLPNMPMSGKIREAIKE